MKKQVKKFMSALLACVMVAEPQTTSNRLWHILPQPFQNASNAVRKPELPYLQKDFRENHNPVLYFHRRKNRFRQKSVKVR